MLGRYLHILVKPGQKEHPQYYRILWLLFGAGFFLYLLPWLFILAGRFLGRFIFNAWPFPLEAITAAVCIPACLSMLIWAIHAHWSVGRGTPVPFAPTQQLNTDGPYRFCRNPIQLSLMLYYLGTGALIDGLTSGLLGFGFVLVFFSLYHKLVEEKELYLRFGDAYKEYRDKTPFLIPKILKNRT